MFIAAALATANWQPPVTALGWFALIGSSIAMAIAVLAVFVSTARVGPFRTALFMNLEPLLATIGSAIFLGEVITPVAGARRRGDDRGAGGVSDAAVRVAPILQLIP